MIWWLGCFQGWFGDAFLNAVAPRALAAPFSLLRAASWKLEQQVIRVAMADEDVDEEPSPQTSSSREWG